MHLELFRNGSVQELPEGVDKLVQVKTSVVPKKKKNLNWQRLTSQGLKVFIVCK